MRFLYKAILLATLLFVGSTLLAQHELSVEVGGGLSTLNYNVLYGNQKDGWAGEFGTAYSYFFSPKFNLRSGANLSFYQAKATLSNLADSYDAYDGEEYFDFRYKVNSYEENQHALYLNIPIMAEFRFGKNEKFYAGAGGKFGLPLLGKYKTSKNSFKTSGYFPSTNVELEEPEFMGFGSFNNMYTKDDIDLHVTVMLSLEAGAKWQLSEKFRLYTGVYFDYGLNNIIRNNSHQPLIRYTKVNSRGFILNGIPTSNYTDDNNNIHSLTEKIRPMAIGIKVRLAMIIK